MQQIFGLNYDYENRNGKNLVLFRDDGILEDELSRIQLKMLQTGQVPRLLPFVAEHLDGRVRFVYDIGSRRMLQQALRAEPLSVLKALQLFVTVITTLEECRSYMLRDSGFLLRETFLFVGADVTDVSFVYVPLTRMEAPLLAEELERFIRMVSGFIPDDERYPLLAFADYCRSGTFRIKELKRKVIERLTAPLDPAHLSGDLTIVRPNKPVWHDPLFHLEGASAASAADNSDTTDISGDTDDGSPASSKKFRQRLSIAFAAAGAVGCAWLWNRWLEQPSRSLFYVSIGVTLLTMDVWLFIRFAVSLVRAKTANLKPPINNSVPMLQEAVKADAGYALTPSLHEPSIVPIQEVPPSAPIDPREYYASLSKHTTLLRKPADVTVLLKPAPQAVRSPHVYAYLEASEERPSKPIRLGMEPFVIGRSGESADYELDGEGISRQHVEIVYEEGSYAAKDLGSTNGTLWNGESMVPYRSYPLQDGDCLTIARTELKFRFVENICKTV